MILTPGSTAAIAGGRVASLQPCIREGGVLTLGEADAALSGGQKDCACGGAFRHRWLGQRRTGGAAYPGR